MNQFIKLWRFLTQANSSITDIETRRQSTLLAGLIVVLISTSMLASFLLVSRNGMSQTVEALWIALAFTAVLYFLNRSGRYRPAAFLFVSSNFALIFLSTIFTEDPSWLMFSTMFVILSAMLLPRFSVVVYLLGVVTHIIFGNFFPVSGTLTNFGGTVSYIVLGPLILVFMIHRASLERERQEELQRANEALKVSEAELEQRVAARTRDLHLASDVARRITTVLDLEELLPNLAEQTKNAFGLDFVSIYLFDPEEDRLVLAAGTDETGRKMREEGIGFKLNARPSLVAQAARERQSIVIPDVGTAEFHAKNPYLPGIQSEAVFPMIVGEDLIGVIGTQSNIKGRFGQDEEEIFSILAEQIAIAVKNAQLFEIQKKHADELRQADQTKSQFLASMSHELRTPMNAIINFTEMVTMGMMGPVNEEQSDLLNQSLDSSKYLLNLINDVLDISKIQAGKLTLFVEDDVDLEAELKTALTMVEPLLSSKPVILIQDIDDNLPHFSGDKRRIRQIILNLLTNAVKFTDQGSITLSVKNRENNILLAVADTGPGISKELQALIFEPFTQTENGMKHAEGTGLGLPITMSLVEAHGGRLWLESERDQGAAFYVTLPVHSVPGH